MTTKTKQDPKKESITSELYRKTQGIIELPEKPFEIFNAKNMLVISDIHFPYHNLKAVETALNYRNDPDVILLLGDLMDFYGLSRYYKRPDLPTIREELDLCRSFLVHLKEKFPKARIIYYEGNHEQRLDTYIMSKAPALFNLEYTTLEIFLHLKEQGIELIRNGHIIKAGELFLIHGNETGIKGGINVARSMLLKTYDNVLFGNFHKTQSSSGRSIGGKEFVTNAIGCLCGLNPAYMPVANSWNLGFAFIEFYKKEFEVHNKRILHNYNIR